MSMVSPMPKPSRCNASCCRVAVVKGGRGRRRSVSRSADRTASRDSPMRFAASCANSSIARPSSPTALPSSRHRVAGNGTPSAAASSAWTVQDCRGTKASISASAVADEAQRHRLHPARRAAARQLAPENRREAVADQVVECAPRLPGPHQVHVEIPGPRQGRAHRRRRHLVEGDPVHRHVADGISFREPFEHLPGDRLALAVGVGRQHQGLGVRKRLRHRRQRPSGAPCRSR